MCLVLRCSLRGPTRTRGVELRWTHSDCDSRPRNVAALQIGEHDIHLRTGGEPRVTESHSASDQLTRSPVGGGREHLQSAAFREFESHRAMLPQLFASDLARVAGQWSVLNAVPPGRVTPPLFRMPGPVYVRERRHPQPHDPHVDGARPPPRTPITSPAMKGSSTSQPVRTVRTPAMDSLAAGLPIDEPPRTHRPPANRRATVKWNTVCPFSIITSTAP